MRVRDKVILLTGAGRGIGRATALLLAAEGARLALLDQDAAALDEVVTAIERAGVGQAIALLADVTRADQLAQAVAKMLAWAGRIDVLINNAGVTADAQFGKMTEEQFDRVIAINLKGVFLVTQAVLPAMIAAGKGKIISASSIVASHGNFGQTNYAASKAGVVAMTKTWAREFGKQGITANAVAPGFILTDMTRTIPAKVLALTAERTPLARLGTPEDIAKAYLFLSSDDSDFINGHVLAVDGGLGS